VTGTIGPVPNQPKVKVSTFRIPPELKARAIAAASANGTTLTAIIIAALEAYVKKNGSK
jgi:predicted HicB family RNase H-like nuclease